MWVRKGIQMGSAFCALLLLIGTFLVVPVTPQSETANVGTNASSTLASSTQAIADGDYIQYTVTVGLDSGTRRFDFRDVNATSMTVDITSTIWYFPSVSFTANYSYQDNMVVVPGLMGDLPQDGKVGEAYISTTYGTKHVNVFNFMDSYYSEVQRTFLVPIGCLVYYKYYGNDTNGNNVVMTLDQTNIGWLQNVGQLIEGDYSYVVDGGAATIVSYSGSGGAIIIPGILGGLSVTAIGNSAFAWCTNLTSVAFNNSVVSIAVYAFRWSSNLTSVTFGDNLQTIGEWAFANCHLTSVTIPDSVVYIGVNAFATNDRLTGITVGAGNPNYANHANDGVLYNKAITLLMQYPGGRPDASYTIPDTVVSIEQYASNSVTHLTSVTIPASVSIIGTNAFRYCLNLTSITFLGLVAPISVGSEWIIYTDPEIRGHAYSSSDFPAPGGAWNGLTMGAIILEVPGAPTNLTIFPSNAQALLRWIAPGNDGGEAITHYKVYLSTTEIGTYSLVASPNNPTFRDTGLTNNQTYWYSVSAVNSIGEGPKTSPMSSIPRELPSGFAKHDTSKGYSILVPNGWTVQDELTIGSNHADTYITGPMSGGVQTNIIVITGSDSSIRDTKEYLEDLVQRTISALEAELGTDVVITDGPEYFTISGHSAVIFGQDIGVTGIHQQGIIIIDAEHHYYWTISCTESTQSRSELDPVFDTIAHNFVITSVPGMTDSDIILLVVIAGAAGLAVIGMLVFVVRRQRCPRCGTRVKKDWITCGNCGQQLKGMPPAP